MYILYIIPIKKIPRPNPQILTYFSPQNVEQGGLVLITLRKNKILGIVAKCESAEKYKISIKQAGYQLKKVDKIVKKEPFLGEIQLKFILWLANYYFASMGQTIKLFIPSALLKGKKIETAPVKRRRYRAIPAKKIKPILFVAEQRLNHYINQINLALKNKKQILFLAPNLARLKIYDKYLVDAGIKTTQIHANLSPREQFEKWKNIGTGKPLVALGARSALFYPFNDLGLIIVDEEQNHEYKSWDQSPYYNARDAALKLAELAGAKIILGTPIPDVESYWNAKQKKYQLRIDDKKENWQTKIIDMKEEIKRGNSSAIGKELRKTIEETIAQKGKIILLINRRGASTFILCRDCGYVAKCSECEAPLVYHLDSNALLCHHCVKKLTPPNLCPKCKSWRIKYLGGGTQKIIHEIKNLFPGASALRLDSDIAKKLSEQEKIWNDFIAKDNQILVATQLVLKFLIAPIAQYPMTNIQTTGIVNIDISLNMPDFRSGEKLFQIISKIRQFASPPYFLIQTYHPENSTIKYAAKNDFESFYKEEIKNRKMFSYPPFSKIIKLTYRHKNPKKAEEEAKILYAKLNQFLITNKPCPKPSDSDQNQEIITLLGPVPAFVPKIKNHYIWHIIIKLKNSIPSEVGGQKSKISLLNMAGSGWKIDVDPENLL